MSAAERLEVRSYIPGWQKTPARQFAQELASLSHETHRIADPYYYTITSSGELFSSTACRKIKDTVDKTSRLGQLEYQAVLATEKLAAEHEEGAIVWISPPYGGSYTTSKIIIHQLESVGGNKRLFNRAIVLDIDGAECMKLAWNLTSFSSDKPVFTDLDQVRSTPLFLATQGKSWINILEKFINDPVLWEQVRNGEDILLKKEALRRAAIVQKQYFNNKELYITEEAIKAVTQMLGPKGGSCPPTGGSIGRTALGIISENSLTYYGSSLNKDPDFCRNCPVCGKEINCVVRNGGSCPQCMAVKRCG